MKDAETMKELIEMMMTDMSAVVDRYRNVHMIPYAVAIGCLECLKHVLLTEPKDGNEDGEEA